MPLSIATVGLLPRLFSMETISAPACRVFIEAVIGTVALSEEMELPRVGVMLASLLPELFISEQFFISMFQAALPEFFTFRSIVMSRLRSMPSKAFEASCCPDRIEVASWVARAELTPLLTSEFASAVRVGSLSFTFETEKFGLKTGTSKFLEKGRVRSLMSRPVTALRSMAADPLTEKGSDVLPLTAFAKFRIVV